MAAVSMRLFRVYRDSRKTRIARIISSFFGVSSVKSHAPTSRQQVFNEFLYTL